MKQIKRGYNKQRSAGNALAGFEIGQQSLPRFLHEFGSNECHFGVLVPKY